MLDHQLLQSLLQADSGSYQYENVPKQQPAPFMLMQAPRAPGQASNEGLKAMLPAKSPVSACRAPVRGPDTARLQVMLGHAWQPQLGEELLVEPALTYDIDCQVLLLLAGSMFSM
jgi:hypothetical protein